MFKIPFQMLKNNMLFIQPLLFYLLIIMVVSAYIADKTVLLIPKILLIISIFLLTVAFISGWFYINKLAIADYNEDDEQEKITAKTIKNFKQFFSGVGENFLNNLLASLIYLALYIGLNYLLSKICLAILGQPVIFLELSKIAESTTTQADIINYLNGVSLEDKLVFTKWVMLAILLCGVLNHFGILYFSILTTLKKNALISFVKTIEFIFKNILGNIAIIVAMFAGFFGLNILSMILGANSFSFVILIILFALYLNYYILLVFWYYNEQTKNNSNNRTEFIG